MTAQQDKSQQSLITYRQRLEPVFSFINKNLNRTILLSEAAEVGHFSKYHFHRIFSAVTGESLNDYINRCRLERAANMLLFRPQFSVTHVALCCGFSSSANFSRAFKNHFGVKPTGIRKQIDNNESKKGRLNRHYGHHLSQEMLDARRPLAKHELSSHQKVQPGKIIQIKETPVVYIRSQKGYELSSIMEAWNKITHWGISKGIELKSQEGISFCRDNPLFTPIHLCRYDAAIFQVDIPDDEIPLPFKKDIVPAGNYAVFPFRGTPDKANEFYSKIFSVWLPHSGYEPCEAPLMEKQLNTVEMRDNKIALTDSPNIVIEAWLQVKPLKRF